MISGHCFLGSHYRICSSKMRRKLKARTYRSRLYTENKGGKAARQDWIKDLASIGGQSKDMMDEGINLLLIHRINYKFL